MLRLIYIFCFLVLLSTFVFADLQVSIYTYKFTITKIELSTEASGDDNWITAAEGSQITNPTIDVVQGGTVSIGDLAGQLVQNISVPTGTYVRCKVTVNPTVYFKGAVSHESLTYYSPSGVDATSTPAAVGSEPNPWEDSYCTVQNTTSTATGTFTVSEGQTTTLKISMDTSNCLTLQQYGGDYYMILNQFSWSFSQ